MQRTCFLTAVAILLFALLHVAAQQPPAPAFPAIAPATARLDQTITNLDGPGFAVAVGGDGALLAAACEHGTVLCWQKDVTMGIRAGGGTAYALTGHQGPVTGLSMQGTTLASVGVDGKILVWEMPEGKLLQTLTAPTRVRAILLAPDGKTLVTAGEDKMVQFWDVASGKAGAKLAGHADWVLALAFSPDGKQLASGSIDGVVKLWDVAGAKQALEFKATPPPAPNTQPGPTNSVMALAYSPDGKSLAVGGTDAGVHLFNPADGKLVRTMPGHTSSVTELAWHPSGTVLVSSSNERTVRLWNPAAGQMLKSLEGHTSWVEGVSFLAQGTRLASVGADATVRIWDLSDPTKK